MARRWHCVDWLHRKMVQIWLNTTWGGLFQNMMMQEWNKLTQWKPKWVFFFVGLFQAWCKIKVIRFVSRFPIFDWKERFFFFGIFEMHRTKTNRNENTTQRKPSEWLSVFIVSLCVKCCFGEAIKAADVPLFPPEKNRNKVQIKSSGNQDLKPKLSELVFVGALS